LFELEGTGLGTNFRLRMNFLHFILTLISLNYVQGIVLPVPGLDFDIKTIVVVSCSSSETFVC